MKDMIAFCCILFAGLPMAMAAPSKRSEKTTVSGVVIDSKHGILMLSDYKGWNRRQSEYAPLILRGDRKTRRWLESFDENCAAIFINPDDARRIRRGMRVVIEDYRYFWDEWGIYPEYLKVTVTK